MSSFPVPGKLCLCMVASFLTAEMMKAIELPYKCEMAPKITAAYDSETGKWYEGSVMVLIMMIKEGISPMFVREFGAPFC